MCNTCSFSLFHSFSLHVKENVIGGVVEIADKTVETAKSALLKFGSWLCAAATLGLCDKPNRWAKEMGNLPNLFGTIFYRFLKMLNPYAKLDESAEMAYSTCSDYVAKLINPPRKPMKHLVSLVEKWLSCSEAAFDFADTADRVFSSRACYLIATPGFILSRIADLGLGMVGAVFAFLTFGTNTDLNTFAFKNLNTFYLIAELSESTRGVINPQALEWKRA